MFLVVSDAEQDMLKRLSAILILYRDARKSNKKMQQNDFFNESGTTSLPEQQIPHGKLIYGLTEHPK